MPSAKPRQVNIHPPVQEDQRTAGDISGAFSATNAQELFELLLSQIKRIIYGSDPGNWRDDPETALGANASLKALLTASGSIVPDKVQSGSGQYTVPSSVAVGDLVYSTGSLTADRADNSSYATSEAFAGVIDKPTATTATLVYGGVLSGLSGLTPGGIIFVGTLGGVVQAGSLPSSSGSVVKPIGMAITATSAILAPKRSVVI